MSLTEIETVHFLSSTEHSPILVPEPFQVIHSGPARLRLSWYNFKTEDDKTIFRGFQNLVLKVAPEMTF